MSIESLTSAVAILAEKNLVLRDVNNRVITLYCEFKSNTLARDAELDALKAEVAALSEARVRLLVEQTEQTIELEMLRERNRRLITEKIRSQLERSDCDDIADEVVLLKIGLICKKLSFA